MSWQDYIPGYGIPGVGNLGDVGSAVGNYFGQAFTAPPSTYQDRDKISGLIDQGFNQMGSINPAEQQQFRAMQMQQAQNLQRIASGQQQGAGELAAQRQTQNAVAQQQGMARMARGGNSALAFRNAASNAANVGLSGAGQAQQAALQDQANAQGQLSNALNQGRSGDFTQQQNQIGMQNSNNNMYLGLLGQLTGMNANELQARINASNAQKQMMGGMIAGAGQIGAQAAMASDERLKEDISDGSGDIDEMLDRVFPRAYVYKEPARWGQGRRVGVMAQHLETSKAGRDIVRDTPDGKMLDKDALLSATFAATARLNQRLRELEGRK